MKIDNQVCSLPLAKRLKELGVTLESEYQWEWSKTPPQKPRLRTSGARGCARCGAVINGIPLPTQFAERANAYSVAELGEVIRKHKDWDEPLPHLGSDGWYYYADDFIGPKCRTEADARAKLIIHLLERDGK